MLRNMITFYNAANDAVERTAAAASAADGSGGKITYNVIKARLGDLLYKLRWAWGGCAVVAGWGTCWTPAAGLPLRWWLPLSQLGISHLIPGWTAVSCCPLSRPPLDFLPSSL